MKGSDITPRPYTIMLESYITLGSYFLPRPYTMMLESYIKLESYL